MFETLLYMAWIRLFQRRTVLELPKWLNIMLYNIWLAVAGEPIQFNLFFCWSCGVNSYYSFQWVLELLFAVWFYNLLLHNNVLRIYLTCIFARKVLSLIPLNFTSLVKQASSCTSSKCIISKQSIIKVLTPVFAKSWNWFFNCFISNYNCQYM